MRARVSLILAFLQKGLNKGLATNKVPGDSNQQCSGGQALAPALPLTHTSNASFKEYRY